MTTTDEEILTAFSKEDVGGALITAEICITKAAAIRLWRMAEKGNICKICREVPKATCCISCYNNGQAEARASALNNADKLLESLNGNTAFIEALCEVWAESDVENFQNTMENAAKIYKAVKLREGKHD
jgi:hypothetical protein